MRTIFTILLVGSLISTAGCRRTDPKFLLSAQLEQPVKADAPMTIIIDLKNTSTRVQKVIVPTTNFFWGAVYCRGTNGDIRRFNHTNIFGWMTTVTVYNSFDLEPGASRQWRHPLTDFAEFSPGVPSQPAGFQAPTWRFLDREFQRGCDLWCAFDVAEEDMAKTTESLSTPRIGYPQRTPPKVVEQSRTSRFAWDELQTSLAAGSHR